LINFFFQKIEYQDSLYLKHCWQFGPEVQASFHLGLDSYRNIGKMKLQVDKILQQETGVW